MNDLEGLEAEDFFEIGGALPTRDHCKEIFKPFCRLDIRKHFFSQRVIDEWNNLPTDIIESKTVNEFKNKIEPLFMNVKELSISRRRLPAPILKTSGEPW